MSSIICLTLKQGNYGGFKTVCNEMSMRIVQNRQRYLIFLSKGHSYQQEYLHDDHVLNLSSS